MKAARVEGLETALWGPAQVSLAIAPYVCTPQGQGYTRSLCSSCVQPK